MKSVHVVVSGAGPAGLTLAHRLHRAGVRVTVVERDTAIDSRDPGYRLHVNSWGTVALHRALEPELWQLFLDTSGMPDPEMPMFDEHLTLRPRRDHAATEGDGPPPGVPEHLVASRTTLRRVLALGLGGAIRFGRRVTGYTERSGHAGVEVHLDDGTSIEADLLVGADGINSAVRTQLLPQLRVVDLGSRHVAAKVPLDDETRAALPPEVFSTFTVAFDDARTGLTFAPLERSAPRSPLVSGQDAVFVAEARQDFALSIFNSTAAAMLPDEELFAAGGARLQAHVLDRIDSWHPGLRAIVEHWDLATVQPPAQRSCLPVEAWSPSQVTLLGDAVHAMSNALGIGANTALWDADLLGTELLAAIGGGRPLVTAVAAYEPAMREFGFAALRRSAAAGHRIIGHAELSTT